MRANPAPAAEQTPRRAMAAPLAAPPPAAAPFATAPLVAAIVGQANVGKSTLFNRLTGRRDALVADHPGLTRDRQYGDSRRGGRTFRFIDTGGIGAPGDPDLAEGIREQAMLAIREAAVVLWVLDGREELNAADQDLGALLRGVEAPVLMVLNKMEGLDPGLATAERHCLGFRPILPVSARRGQGMARLWTCLCKHAEALQEQEREQRRPESAARVAILGRPNAGKSTLINQLLGEHRLLTRDQPGTTRDAIRVPLHYRGQDYLLIDTAGVRRRRRINGTVEKRSAARSLGAMSEAELVLFLIDGAEGVTEQDRILLGQLGRRGRPLVIAVNKCDTLNPAGRRRLEQELVRSCRFVTNYAASHFLSALTGQGTAALFDTIRQLHRRRAGLPAPSSARLTEILHRAAARHPPPMVRGRRIRLRYAHLGGLSPLRVIVHGKQTRALPASYLLYLGRIFREQLHLAGIPVQVECRQNDNPFQPLPGQARG